MDILILVFTLGLAVLLYSVFNKILRVTYFGFAGIITVFAVCLLIAYSSVEFIFAFIGNHYGWVIAVGIVIALIFLIAKSKKVSTKTNEQIDDDDDETGNEK